MAPFLDNLEELSSSIGGGLWNIVWNLNSPNKVKLFILRVRKGILPTLGNFNSRGLDVDPMCPCWCSIEKGPHFPHVIGMLFYLFLLKEIAFFV